MEMKGIEIKKYKASFGMKRRKMEGNLKCDIEIRKSRWNRNKKIKMEKFISNTRTGLNLGDEVRE